MRRLLSSVAAACLERRASATLQRTLCYWFPLAIAAASIALPSGSPIGVLAIPGALLAAAAFSRPRAAIAVIAASAALVAGPAISLARGRSDSPVVDVATIGTRIVLVIGMCLLVGRLFDLLRRTREIDEEVSRALDLHLYAGNFRLDDRYRETYTGPGVERLLGRPLRPDERPEDAWDAAVHPDDRSAFTEFFSADGLSTQEFSELEYRIVGNDGSARWVLDRVHATHAEDGTVHINGLCLDITERRRVAEELRDARERLTRLVEAVDDVFFELELTAEGDLRALHVNPGISRLLGAPPGPDVLASWRGAVHEDDQPALREHIAEMRSAEATETEYRMLGKDGVVRNVWSRVFPHRDIDGRLLLVGVLSDITERTRMAEDLEVALAAAERQAQTDALTGLANRARLSATMDARLERHDTAVCTGLLLLDVDRFKRINDTHGHQAGDEVLIELGRRLTSIVGERGLVARLGGEELAVLVTGARHEPGLRDLAEEVRAGVGDTPMIVEGLRIPVTVSIGAAQGGESFLTRDSLLSAADRALYAAKRRGRNQVCLVGDLTQRDLEREVPEAVRIAQSLALLASAREGIHEAHCEQVAELSSAVATELGLANDAIQRCYLGGWLHDIGKASIPDRILEKSGPLDDEEWQLMHAHVALGEGIVVRIDEIASSAPAVRHHHERVDGHGYPDGLEGDAIPIEARVVAAADAYCAIAADRVYARGRDRDAALDELSENVGSHLDERVVEALIRVVKRQALQAERRKRVRHPRAA